jgi:hypothetical protein
LFEDISKPTEDSATKEESSDKEKEKDVENVKEKEEAAATKIQAVFRGHHARKSLKEKSETASEQTKTDEAPSETQLQEEFPLDDKGERLYLEISSKFGERDRSENGFCPVELCDAAKKIQATFRGHMSRKEQATAAAKSAIESATAKIEEKVS